MDSVRGSWLAALALVGGATSACLDAPPDARSGAPDAYPGCPSLGQLSDEFDAEQPDLWQEFGGRDSCTLAVDGGRLEVDASGDCGLASATCYDMSDRWVQVDAVMPGPGLEFSVHLNDFGDDLVIAIDKNDALSVRWIDPDGVETALSTLPFDPAVHQLWRIWHSASENRITFETAERAAPAWSRLAELWLDGLSVTQVQVRLGARDTGGMVAFDSLHGVDL
jgi:hypothetical protein